MGTHSNQPILGLKLFLGSFVVVYQGKTSAPSTTEVCSETERDNTALLGLVDSGKLLREIGLGDIGSRRVQNVDNELATR